MTPSGTVVLRALGRALIAYLVLLTLVGGAGLWGLWDQGGSLGELVRGSLPRAALLSQVREATSHLEIGLLRFMGYYEADLSRARDSLEKVAKGLRELAGEGFADTEPLLLQVGELREQLEQFARVQDADALEAAFRSLRVGAQGLDEEVEAFVARLRTQDVARGEKALERAQGIRRGLAAGLLAGWVLSLATAVFALRRLQNPFREVLAFLAAAAEKDLSGQLQARSRDEFGALARAASSLGGTLVGALRTLGRVASEIASRGAGLGGRAAAARERGEVQIGRVEAGGRKAREVEATLEPVGALAAELWDGAEQAASSVQQILAMTEQVRAEMDGLCQRVTASTRSMEELSGASTRVAALTAQVGAAAQTVAASAAAIDQATEVLSAGAGEGRQLTEDVVGRAEAGRASMAEALRGMERIRSAVDAAVQSFERLEGGLLRVGRVTQVIDDIAGRTNLLSLNAAIIAAQAGERGKAFGVVAGEIRSLAEKTGASTREIRAIVEGVVSGGREAAQAVTEGAVRVADGARQAQETGELLGAIHAGAARAAGRLREIEAAAAGQSREAGRVAEEILQVSQGVEQIAGAVRDQEARTRAVHAHLAEIDLVARQTLNAADEQTKGTELITNTVVDVSHASERVKAAIAQVAELLRGLREDLEALGDQARQDLEQVSQLEVEGEGLASLAGEIHREVGAFRLPAG